MSSAVAEHAGLHEALGLPHQRVLVDEVAADHAVLRILAVSDEGPDAVDPLPGLVGLLARRPAARAARSRTSRSFASRLAEALARTAAAPAPGAKFLMLPRITGTSVVGRSLHRGRVMSISPTQRMPYASSHASMASRASAPARERRQPVQEVVVRRRAAGTPRPRGCGRIASATSSSASPISEVTLWGTDCVRVSAAFLSPSHSCRWSSSHHAASIADMNT